MGGAMKRQPIKELTASMRPKWDAEKAMQANEFTIFVETWTSRTLELAVMGSDSIYKIKEILCYKEKIPIDRQILMFEGQELEGYQTVEHYGIKEGSWLHQRVKRYVLDIISL